MKIIQGGTICHGGIFVPDKTLDELRLEATRRDIKVWANTRPRFDGDDAPFLYRKGIEVGGLMVETETEALKYLLERRS
jgi:hypothetical protein